jgi:hypothetical protein
MYVSPSAAEKKVQRRQKTRRPEEWLIFFHTPPLFSAFC